MAEPKWSNDIAKESYQLYKQNKADRAAWERDAVRFDDFRYGAHFSAAEESEIIKFRQAPLPISITTAICDTAESLMVASKPVIKVAPIINPYDEQKTNISKKVAQIYNFLVQKSWYDSLGELQYDRVVRDYTNVGHGLFYIVPRNEYGEFTVDIKHISWRYFYPHSMTRDPFYRDADNNIIAMRISEKAGYRFVRNTGTEVTEEQFGKDWMKGSDVPLSTINPEPTPRYSPNGLRSSGTIFTQRMMLEEQKVYVIVPLKDVKDIYYKTVMELTPDLQKKAKDGEVTVHEDKRFMLTEYTSVGNMGFKKIYPIDCYNIVPLVYDHRDNPYPLGRIWYLYPLQRALNKFIMIALLNGSLMNAVRIISEHKSIVNKDEWKHTFSTPGAMLEWKQVVPGQSQPPQIIDAKPLSEAFLQFPRYIAYIMEYISGIFGIMMGDTKDAPNVFSTVASLQSAGSTKIKRRLAQADAALSQVGYVVGKFYKHYAPPNSYATIIDEFGQQSEPQKYNQLRPYERKNDKGETERGIETIPETDLSYGFKDIRFTTQASNGFEAGTEAALLTNLATQLKVPALIPAILKRINIADVDKVIQNLDVATQQEGQIEQLTKTVKDLEQRTKVLAGQVMQKGFELSKAQADKAFTKILAEAKNNPEVMNSVLSVLGENNGGE